MEKKEIGVGILGLGNVGKGTFDILEKNHLFIDQETSPYKIKVIGLSDLDKNRKPVSAIYHPFFSNSALEVIENPDIQIIVESIGGENPAYDFIKTALKAGKHVVSPNKEVVAKHGYELITLARENKVQFLFETSVGSAIPVLGVLTDILTSCPLEEITGILNGTTNYILDLMSEEKISQTEAIKKAQEMGYAEADPSKDVKGLDPLYKIFILSSLGFRGQLDLDKISYFGISSIKYEDIYFSNLFGYVIKVLATAKKEKDESLDIRVRPVLIDQNHVFSKIHGADNGILLYGESYGELFFSGAGAGGVAGGSMIVSDLVRIIKQPHQYYYDFLIDHPKKRSIIIKKESKSAYLLRIKKDKIETEAEMEKMNEFFGEYQIKIQKSESLFSQDGMIDFGFLLKETNEGHILKMIDAFKKQFVGVKEIHYIPVYCR